MQTINRPTPFRDGKGSRPSKDGKGPGPGKDGKGPLSSKNGSIGAAILAAALAAAAIVVFINQYKDNINDDSVPTPVLVADEQIAKGASGDTLGELGLFKSSEVPKDQLKAGAITDAAVLKGKVASVDILPGQQLTRSDFKAAGSGVITKLDATQRAIALPLDKAHGLIGPVKVGDHVDVLSGFLVDTGAGRPKPVLRTIAQDVLVLSVPEAAGGAGVRSGGNSAKEVTLRVDSKSAPKLAFASEYGKVWLVLRPANGEDVDKRSLVTIESMLFTDLANSQILRAARNGR